MSYNFAEWLKVSRLSPNSGKLWSARLNKQTFYYGTCKARKINNSHCSWSNSTKFFYPIFLPINGKSQDFRRIVESLKTVSYLEYKPSLFFQNKYHHLKPLCLTCKNECGVEKLIMTFIKVIKISSANVVILKILLPKNEEKKLAI
jgi:hypothetical protein